MIYVEVEHDIDVSRVGHEVDERIVVKTGLNHDSVIVSELSTNPCVGIEVVLIESVDLALDLPDLGFVDDFEAEDDPRRRRVFLETDQIGADPIDGGECSIDGVAQAPADTSTSSTMTGPILRTRSPCISKRTFTL